MRRSLLLGLAVLGLAFAGFAIAQVSKDEGRIGPSNKVQPSGRKLAPVGKLTKVGNHPAGGALTTNGRFYWTLSAGRGRNDVRIVRVTPRTRCRKPSRRSGRAGARRYRACRRKAAAEVGKVVQTLPMPGLSGGMAMAPDGRTAYVSGTPESTHDDQLSPQGTPGKEGDVIHVLRYDPKTGKATRAGTIGVPPPAGVPLPQSLDSLRLQGTSGPPQDFPPTRTKAISWPRDIALSPDGKRMLVALNLADRAAIVDTATRAVRYVKVGSYPYGAAITQDGEQGLVSNEADGTVSVIDLDKGTKTKDITVGPHLSHPEGIAIDRSARVRTLQSPTRT